MTAGISRVKFLALLLAATGLAGCQADYAADIHNKTPTPLFAQIMVKANDHSQPASLGASRRLGPGDRAAIGPVRANAKPGSAYLVVDTLPNPGKPLSFDLNPGTSFIEVTQEGDAIGSPLHIGEKR